MKKILIFSTRAGGGHTSVSDALKSYLEPQYHVEIVDIFTDVLFSLDPIRTFTYKKVTLVDAYNKYISTRLTSLFNWVYKYALKYFWLHKRTIIRTLDTFIQKHKPDLIISVVPIFNQIILDISKQNNLPFLLIPTDFDSHTFMYQLKRTTYNRFVIAQSFDFPEIRKFFTQAGIPDTQIQTTGLPLRLDFYKAKDITTLKKKYTIPENKPVLMILMGSQGADFIVQLTRTLMRITIPIHLILCTGKRTYLVDKLAAIPFPPHITRTIVPFTPHISEFMATADMILTKSGTISVCEAIHMRIPSILDATRNVLEWEKLNHKIIKKLGIGTSVQTEQELLNFVTKIFSSKQEYMCMKHALENIPSKNTPLKIQKLVAVLVSQKSIS